MDDSELQVFKSAEAVVAATEPSIVVETPAAETKVPETELPALKTTETNISTAKAEVYSAYKSQQQSVWKEPEYTYRPPKTEPVYTISETRDVFDKQDNIASNIIDFTDTDSGVIRFGHWDRLTELLLLPNLMILCFWLTSMPRMSAFYTISLLRPIMIFRPSRC